MLATRATARTTVGHSRDTPSGRSRAVADTDVRTPESMSTNQLITIS